jgi:outer membrane protein TolC
MPLPAEPYLGRPLEELVNVALNNRPELAENQALVEAAVERVRTAKFRPLLPNLVVGYSWGGFGGGPDPNPQIILPPAQPGGEPRVVNQAGAGPSGRILNFGLRSDFDVTLVWRLQNLGLGNLAELRENQAAFRQASLRLVQVRDLVVAQMVQAHELVEGYRQRVETTRQALFDARGAATGPVFESLRLNFQRIREVEKTRPLEVLDSIRGLNDLLEAYGLAVTDYERARFRLLTALGLSPQAILDLLAACAPLPAK